MPNDAKLGMVFGVGLVLIFAVVFFRKGSSASPSADIPRALTPAPRMSGGRGPASPRPVNRIGRPPEQATGVRETHRERPSRRAAEAQRTAEKWRR